MKVCPYCEQDALWWCSITDVGDGAVICAECDTVWTHDEEVAYGTGKNFDDLMESRGKVADWKFVERKRKVEE